MSTPLTNTVAREHPEALVLPGAGALRAAVLLAGAVRESPLVRGAKRALLDLPLTSDLTIGGEWVQRIAELGMFLGRPRLPLIIATTPATPDVSSTQPGPIEGATVVQDSGPLRGTGGALVDLCERFEDDDLLLVANAHAVALRPLAGVVAALLETESDVALHADQFAAPTGFFMARVRALREIPRRGFVDFKEQALDRIARRHAVRVVSQRGPHVVPVRTLEGYIRAVRSFNAPGGRLVDLEPLAEEWRSTFGLVEPGAKVAPGARIMDSVVLAGAEIGANAVVARAVVCPGARVEPGEFVGDEVIGEEGVIS